MVKTIREIVIKEHYVEYKMLQLPKPITDCKNGVCATLRIKL